MLPRLVSAMFVHFLPKLQHVLQNAPYEAFYTHNKCPDENTNIAVVAQIAISEAS